MAATGVALAGSTAGSAIERVVDSPAASSAPQPVQNWMPGSIVVPQEVQSGEACAVKAAGAGAATGAGCAFAIGWPHDVQKFEDSFTSLPHAEQTAMLRSCSCCCSFQDHPGENL